MAGINSTTAAALNQPQPIPQQIPTDQAGWTQFASLLNQWLQYLSVKPNTLNPVFQAGQVQYAGTNGGLTGSNNLLFGLNLPNPSGVNGAGLLVGSGAIGTAITAFIGQDQAFDDATPGNNLVITSGETQGAGTAAGGFLLGVGGGSFGGRGGDATWQGGTSANGTGGSGILAGGNATNGGIPGDAFVIGGAGQSPGQGANVHLIMTEVNGIAGVVRIRVNSTPLLDFFSDGSIFLYDGTGFGAAGQKLTSGGPGQPVTWA